MNAYFAAENRRFLHYEHLSVRDHYLPKRILVEPLFYLAFQIK